MTTTALRNDCPPWAKNAEDVPADKAKWSGQDAPPNLGDRVVVTMNGLGPGIVKGFFVSSGYLGVGVQLDSPPAWYTEQNKGNPVARVYGAEVRRGAC